VPWESCWRAWGGGSLLGALIGWGVGTFAPGYYRAIVRGGEAPSFQPLEFGLDAGTTQGALAGLAIGAVLICFFTWLYERHKAAGRQ